MTLFSNVGPHVKEPVRPTPSEALLKKYTELVDVRMRDIVHLPRIFRMNMAGHLHAIWPYALPTQVDFKIQENDQYVDVAITAGDKTIWTRWSPVSPKVQVHYNGDTQNVSNGDFRLYAARILVD